MAMFGKKEIFPAYQLSRARSLAVSDLHLKTTGSLFEPGC